MKKTFMLKGVALIALCLALFFTLTACGLLNLNNTNTNKPDDHTSELDFEVVYAAAVDLGFDGTLDDLIAAFKGDKGAKGDKGDKGDKGAKGDNGKSAYEIAVEKGYIGTEIQWLATLIGSTGGKGGDGITPEIKDGYWYIGETNTGVFARGVNGKSAYDIAVDNGFDGTEQEWLDTFIREIQGEQGLPGNNGLSAYDIAVDNGFDGTPQEWLLSLIGIQGLKGDTGNDGRGIDRTEIIGDYLYIYYTDETFDRYRIKEEPVIHTVTFLKTNGNVIKTVEVTHGERIPLSEYPENYRIQEWYFIYTDHDSAGASYDEDETWHIMLSVLEDITLYNREDADVNPPSNSFERLATNIYYMEYYEDYLFDTFLENGAVSDLQLQTFLNSVILKDTGATITIPNFGCSAFTAITPDGDRLFGRNYDFNYNPILVTKTVPENGYSSLSTTDLSVFSFFMGNLPDDEYLKTVCLAAPYVPFDGINEMGVAVSLNMVGGSKVHQNTGKIGLTTTTIIRLILDKADSVQSALDLMSQYDLHESTGGPFHYQIADKTGDSAIVEYIGGQMVVTRIAPEDKFQAMTNFIIYNDLGDNFGRARYDILQACLTGNDGVLTEEEAAGLLYDARIDELTMWSNVYNLTNGTMTFHPYLNFSVPYYFDTKR